MHAFLDNRLVKIDMKKPYLLLLLVMFVSLYLQADTIPKDWKDNFQIVKNFDREWITIGKDNRYVPYINQDLAEVPVVGISLSLSRYAGNQLLVCLPQNSTVFINKKISSYHDKSTCITLSIDSLKQVYEGEAVFVSVYQPGRVFEQISIMAVQPSSGQVSQNANTLQARRGSLLNNFFVVGILILLTLYAILINQYPKIFNHLYSFSKVFSFKVREEHTRIRLINEAHVAFLIHHCLLLSFIFIVLFSTTDIIQIQIPYFNNSPQSFSGFMLLWVQTSALIFAIIWVKYFIVMLFGSLFKLRQLRQLHMLDFMRMSLIYGAIVFMLLIAVFAGIGEYQTKYFNLLIYLFVGLSSLRVIVLYFRLFSGASFRNIYLISYICIAEVIPLLVSLEILII